MSELSSSILLYVPGNEVISVVVFEPYELGAMTTIAALGVLMVSRLAVFVGIAYWLGADVGSARAEDRGALDSDLTAPSSFVGTP